MKLAEDYILSTYQVQRVLQNTSHSEVALVRSSLDDKLYIRKCYETDKRTIFHELRQIDSPYLPKIQHLFFTDCTVVIEEYVTGKNLQEYIDERRILSKDLFLRIFDQILLALEVLHRHHIIHRDIKPANIMITDDETIKLIDFSIARIYNPLAVSDTELFGTFEYAPPEQFGFSQTDFRSDLYSLGKTMEKVAVLVGGSYGLAKLIKRLRSFDPDDRFQTVCQVQQAIYQRKKQRSRTRFWVALFIVIAALAGVYHDYLEHRVKMETSATSAPAQETEVKQPAAIADDKSTQQRDTQKEKQKEKSEEQLTEQQQQEVKPIREQSSQPASLPEDDSSLTYSHRGDRIIRTLQVKQDTSCMMLSGNQTKSAIVPLAEGMLPVKVNVMKENDTLYITLDDQQGKHSNFTLQKTVNVPLDIYRPVFDGEILFYDLNQDGTLEMFPSIAKRERIVYPQGTLFAGQAYYNTNYTVGWAIAYDKNNGFVLSDLVMEDTCLELVNAEAIEGEDTRDIYCFKNNRLVRL